MITSLRNYPAITHVLALFALLAATGADAEVGRTPGVFNVSSTGAATYTIPIWTPPGIKGVEPRFALTYNSQVSGGLVGTGWSLSGVSGISRCNRTIAQDGARSAIMLSTSDVFCMGGNRLRHVSGGYAADGSTYQTEVATFDNVIARGASGQGPAYFEVQGRDGLTYLFGSTDDSRVIASGTDTASAWMLARVSDRDGNYMSIAYSQETGSVVPTSIQWTSNSNQGTGPLYSMLLTYQANVPASSFYGYLAGTEVINTNLLNSVGVNVAGGGVIKTYSLSYEQSPTTGRIRLRQVTECSNAEQTICLAPTVISYQNGEIGLNETPTAAPTIGSLRAVSSRNDLNGDGLRDILYLTAEDSRLFVAFGTSSGFGSPFDTGLQAGGMFGADALVGDLLGTGAEGILVPSGGAWYYYTWNGSAFTGTALGIPHESALFSSSVLTDFNGDGRPDFIHAVGGENFRIRLRLNASVGTTLTFAEEAEVFSYDSFGLKQILSPTLSWSSYSKGADSSWDFNGDGREDMFFIDSVTNFETGFSWTQYFQLISNGSSYSFVKVYENQSSIFMPGSVNGIFVDWNNDSCTDAIADAVLLLSRCDAAGVASVPLPGFPVAALDWNADGRHDLLIPENGRLMAYLSTGQGLSLPSDAGVAYTSHCVYDVFDFRGDGLDDLVCVLRDPETYVPADFFFYEHRGSTLLPDLLTNVTDGFGVSISPSYASITQNNYTKYADAAFPQRDYIGPLYVVNQFSATDGVGGNYTQSFWYYGAREDLHGRGFQGFRAKRTIDSRNNLQHYQYFGRAFPFTGALEQDDLYQANGFTLIKRTINALSSMTLDGAAYNERYFPFVDISTEYSYEFGGIKNGQLIRTRTTDFLYEPNGNAINIATTVTDNDATAPASPYLGQQWTSTTALTITPDTGGNWCLNLPTSITVTNTAPGVSAVTRRADFTPDYAKCRPTQRVTEPTSGSYRVIEDFEFDGFGNVKKVTTTGNGMTARVSQTDWGTRGQFPMSTTNALNQTTQFGYDFNLGVKTSETDPNGIAVSWQHDNFRRRTRENRPDGTYTTWSYLDCANAGGCLFGSHSLVVIPSIYNSDGTLRTNGAVFFDQYDRVHFEDRRNLDGSYIRVDTRYDSLGRVAQRSMPCTFTVLSTTCSYWMSYSYDALNRMIAESRPINANNSALQTTTYSYQGRTVVTTDAEGKQSTKISTVAGTLGRSQDHNGYYQNFTYDPFGNVTLVTDSLSNTLLASSYVYGIGAFKTGQTDMSMGSFGYTPNALGEVVAYTDANNSNFSLTYDALSRPLTRTVAGEGTTTWTWGNSAASFNIGKLQAITSTNGPTESYTYDNKGRLINQRIVSDASYDYDFAYHSNTGLLDTLTYPTSTSSYRLKLQYGYQNGILNEVKDFNSSTVFWRANAINNRGQVTQETLGNGLVTNKSFDAVTGWINSIQCAIGGGTCAQNHSYLFDKVGNMIQRQNNNLGLTENFFYDNLHRLDYSQLNGQTNLDMTYDAMGNITRRTDVANNALWTYHATKKHQVLQAGSSQYTYSYDANGNALTRNGHSIIWNKYNYPTQINGPGGESVTLSYDAYHARWRQVYTRDGITETTIYAGRQLQKVTLNGVTDYRHSIYANGSTVAIISRKTNGTNATRYVLRDVLGSVAKITDQSGNNIVSESFSAYGNRRNPLTWSGNPTNGDLTTSESITRDGYTGHEALGRLGLNHMNGRVQDAITGRFLSADPYVADPESTQGFNRYSYTMNNPLTYVDPSGFVCEKYALYEGGKLVMTWDNGGCDSWFQGWDSTVGSFSQGGAIDGGGGGASAIDGGEVGAPDAGETTPEITITSEREVTPCNRDLTVVNAAMNLGVGFVSGEFGSTFVIDWTNKTVHEYVYGGLGAGPSSAPFVTGAASIEIGSVRGLDRPDELAGLGYAFSGFAAVGPKGVAGQYFSNFSGDYNGVTAGYAAGLGAAGGVMFTYTSYRGSTTFAEAPSAAAAVIQSCQTGN